MRELQKSKREVINAWTSCSVAVRLRYFRMKPRLRRWNLTDFNTADI